MRYFCVQEAAERLGKSPRQVRRMCDDGTLQGALREGRSWKIPASADIKLQDAEKPTGPAVPELLGLPVLKREAAQRKLWIIEGYEEFAARQVRGGGCRTDALAEYAREKEIGESTLRLWIKKYCAGGFLALIDTRGGKVLDRKTITPDAFEVFKALYLVLSQPGIPACLRILRSQNIKGKKGWTIPSDRVMRRYIKENIPYNVMVFHREGEAAYNAKCAPYIEIDPASIEAGQVWVGDHHQYNCLIRHHNRWVRPWITAWEDMASRMVVGYHVSVSPNQTTILRAMRMGVVEFGPPESAKIDNGKDYDSQMWTGTTKKRRRKVLKAGYINEGVVGGLYAMLGIKASFAIPYHPQSKRVERLFDTMDGQFVKFIPTYCGKDAKRKPAGLNKYLESQQAIDESYDLESFSEIVGKSIEAYNNQAHTGVGMDGRSPAEVMAARTSRRVIRDDVVDLLLRVWCGPIKVGKNGVIIRGAKFGQFNPKLNDHQGEKVMVSYDPDDMRTAYVYEAATLKFITVAECNRAIAYGDPLSEEDVREGMRETRRARKRTSGHVDASRVANMDVVTAAVNAHREAGKAKPKDRGGKTIKPVATPMDGQAAEHKRQQRTRMVKKAAGAEGTEEVLDFNFDSLREPEIEPVKFDLDYTKLPGYQQQHGKKRKLIE